MKIGFQIFTLINKQQIDQTCNSALQL